MIGAATRFITSPSSKGIAKCKLVSLISPPITSTWLRAALDSRSKATSATSSSGQFASGDDFNIDETNDSLSSKQSAQKLVNDKGRFKIDRSKVPVIDEKDLSEIFISGSGPGGQSVNKAVNCCQIKHGPTGIVVKVHQTRSLESNRKLAREILAQKLDNLYNGENSVEAQKKRVKLRLISITKSQAEKRRSMKEEYRQRQSSDANSKLED